MAKIAKTAGEKCEINVQKFHLHQAIFTFWTIITLFLYLNINLCNWNSYHLVAWFFAILTSYNLLHLRIQSFPKRILWRFKKNWSPYGSVMSGVVGCISQASRYHRYPFIILVNTQINIKPVYRLHLTSS